MKVNKIIIIAVVALSVITATGIWSYKHNHRTVEASANAVTAPKLQKVLKKVAPKVKSKPKTVVAVVKSKPAAVQPSTFTNGSCSGNLLSQLVVVDISGRNMWACEGTSKVYSSSVITGMDFLAADLTPTGTYHIYSKQTNTRLKGSDSTGSWNDFVYYWEPFLSNQYGIYGFHDATWRQASEFGNVSPDSKKASHGCVELPLATAKWLYNWSVVGTTLTIQS